MFLPTPEPKPINVHVTWAEANIKQSRNINVQQFVEKVGAFCVHNNDDMSKYDTVHW